MAGLGQHLQRLALLPRRGGNRLQRRGLRGGRRRSGGDYSLWAGVFPSEASELCYAGGQGYGDNWFLCVEKSFAYDGSGNVSWTYNYVSDTEPGFDYTYAVADTSGNDDDVLVTVNTGPTSGSASHTLVPGTSMRSDAGPYTLKFCVFSDGAYSDQDGLYSTTCGAFAVDDVNVNGGGVIDASDFEGGAANGWTLAPAAAGLGGDWSDLVHLSSLPPVLTSCTCTLADSVLIFQDLLANGHGQFQDNLAASPWIDIEAAGLSGSPGKFIELDGYFEMPLLNYVFMHTQTQWYPQVCANTGKLITSPFTSDGLIRFFGGGPLCTVPGGLPIRVDFSAVVDNSAEQVRIAVGVISLCRFFANCSGVSNSTPWIDNIKFGVFGNPEAPFLSTITVDQPQDAFPENGTLRIGAPGRIDEGNIKGFATAEVGSSLGDTLIVNGGTGGAEVYVEFAVVPGPGINLGAFNSWLGSHASAGNHNGLDWYTARIDTAEQGGSVNSGSWMTAYHENDPNFVGSDTDTDPNDIDPNGGQTRLLNDVFPDDLFTPGTRLQLFYKTRFVGGNSWFTTPDTSGNTYVEWECLPTSMSADTTWNCVLYVDHFDGRGAQPFIERALTTVLGTGGSNFEGTNWDRMDIEAPSSAQATFGRPSRTEFGANVVQALGYRSIIWNTGNLSASNLVQEDANVLIPWLTLINTEGGLGNSLYLSGNGVASSMQGEAVSEPRAAQLLNTYIGAVLTCNTVRDLGCPTGSPKDDTACIGLDPLGGARTADVPVRSVSHLGQGNGCPQERQFDLLEVSGGALGTPVAEESYAKAGGAVSAVSISNDAIGAPEYRTVIDGVSVHYRRDVTDCQFNTTSEAAVVERLAEVVSWFGFTGGAICVDPNQANAVEPPAAPRFVTALQSFAPNPLHSGSGQIQFTMERDASASVQIFDVGGRLVREVFQGLASEGVNVVRWDGTDDAGRSVSSGVYFYRLNALGRSQASKLVIVRNGN